MQRVSKISDITVDVLVIGGGPAGITAALAAVRNGTKVALIERYGFLGGNAAFGVGNFCGFYTSGTKKRRVVGGIGWEIIQELVKRKAAVEFFETGDKEVIGTIPYNHEVLKSVFDQILLQEDITLLLHTLAVDPLMDGSIIKGITVENKSGRRNVLANVIIDATGDGDIAAKAGAEYEISEQPQALTMIFTMANVNVPKALSVLGYELERLMKEVIKKEKFSLFSQTGGYVPIPGMPGVIAVNLTRIKGVTGISASDLSQAEIEGRQQVFLYAEFLRQCVPGFEETFLTAIATQVGVRETRRILGDYVLTEEDVLKCKKFKDAIGCNAWPVELHEPSKEGGIRWEYLPEGNSHDIPYRCLVPRIVDGLLVAGRCASTTHVAQASTRVTGPCIVMGQAAGTAAAIATREKILPRNVDVTLLRQILQAQGTILGK